MATVSSTASFVVSASPKQCMNLVRQFFSKNGVQVRREDEKNIEGYQGSQLATRMIGGWLVNPAKLPKSIRIHCRPLASETTDIVVVLEEALGMGMIDRKLRDRYQRGFEDLLTDLKSILNPESTTEGINQIPNEEASEHFERARELFSNFDKATEQDKQRLYRDIAAECALAIEMAGSPFPEAHAMLGWVYGILGQPDRALTECDQALREDPENFMAVAGRVAVLEGRYEEARGRIHPKGWADLLFSLGGAQLKASSFVSELNRLSEVFCKALFRSQDVEEWIWMSELMLEFSDLVDDMPTMLSGKPDLCSPVADASWDTVDLAGHEAEVAEIRRRAEGRALLSKM